MELKIIGNELELANFLLALGRTELITSTNNIAPKIITEIKNENIVQPKKKAKVIVKNSTVPAKVIAKKFNITDQAVRNYARKGMPHIKDGNKFLFVLDDVVPWIENYIAKHPCQTRGKKLNITKKTNPVNLSEYQIWKRKISQMCRDAKWDEGKALSITYKVMTRKYGIVWDQLKKDYKASTNECAPKSTLELAYWLQTNKSVYKNLLEAVLTSVLAGKEK